MGFKTLSGILITRDHRSGRAVIDLSRNDIVDGDLDPGDLRHTRIAAEPGEGNRYFLHSPCYIVSMREFHVQFIDRDDFGARPPRAQTDKLEINSSANETRLTISWTAPAGSGVEEISYLVTGTTTELVSP